MNHQSIPSSYVARRRGPSLSSASITGSGPGLADSSSGWRPHFRSKTLTAAQASDLAAIAREMKAAKSKSNSGASTPTASLPTFAPESRQQGDDINGATSVSSGVRNERGETASAASSTSASRLLSASRHRRARTMATRHAFFDPAVIDHDHYDNVNHNIQSSISSSSSTIDATNASSSVIYGHGSMPSPPLSPTRRRATISSTATSLSSGDGMEHEPPTRDTDTHTQINNNNSNNGANGSGNGNGNDDSDGTAEVKLVVKLEEAHDSVIRRDEEIMASIEGGRDLLSKNDEVASKMLDLEDLFERQNRELDKTKREKAEQNKSQLVIISLPTHLSVPLSCERKS
jgi:hypothetical protein